MKVKVEEKKIFQFILKIIYYKNIFIYLAMEMSWTYIINLINKYSPENG